MSEQNSNPEPKTIELELVGDRLIERSYFDLDAIRQAQMRSDYFLERALHQRRKAKRGAWELEYVI